MYKVGIFNFIFLCTVYFQQGRAQTWSDWNPCDNATVCFQTREKQCSLNAVGMECAAVDEVFEQTLTSGCSKECSGTWGAEEETQACGAQCYDSIRETIATCSNNTFCKRISKKRCYHNQTCSGFWIDSDSNCSKPCGSGITLHWQKCYILDKGLVSSYNCKGTGGDPDAVLIRRAEEDACNPIPCPTWGSWEAANTCTRNCGGGIRSVTSNCLYGRRPSTLCDEAGLSTSKNKTISCNTQDCYTQWSNWADCDEVTCPNAVTRTRKRVRLFDGVEENTCKLATSSENCEGLANITNGYIMKETIDACTKNVSNCLEWSEWKTRSNCSCSNNVQEIRQRVCMLSSTEVCTTATTTPTSASTTITTTTTTIETTESTDGVVSIVPTNAHRGDTTPKNEPDQSLLPIILGAACGGVALLLIVAILLIRKFKGGGRKEVGVYSVQLSSSTRRTHTVLGSGGRNSGDTTGSDRTSTTLSDVVATSSSSGSGNFYEDNHKNLATKISEHTVKVPKEDHYEEFGQRNGQMVVPEVLANIPEGEYEEIQVRPRLVPKETSSPVGTKMDSIESYIAMHNAVVPTYESNIPSRHGTQRSVRRASERSDGSISSGSSDPRGRSSTQSSVTSNVCYSTIDPVNKVTEHVMVKKKKKGKSERKFKRNDSGILGDQSSRSTSLRAPGARLHASSKTPKFSTISENEGTELGNNMQSSYANPSYESEPYQIMSDRASPLPSNEQPYINNPDGEKFPLPKAPVDRRHLSVEIISEEYLPMEGDAIGDITYNDTVPGYDSAYHDTAENEEENVYAGVV